MSALQILGICSALLALTGFVCNEYGILTSEDFLYDFLNMVSSVGLFIYAYSTGVLPFMITNSIWCLVSTIDVVKYLWRKPKPRQRPKPPPRRRV